MKTPQDLFNLVRKRPTAPLTDVQLEEASAVVDKASVRDLNLKFGGFGDTILLRTIQNHQHGLLRVLLSSPKVRCNVANNKGDQPLHVALHVGNLVALNLLLKQQKIDINCANGRQQPLIHALLRCNTPTMAQLLLAHPQIDPNIRYGDKQGTVLHAAARAGCRADVMTEICCHPKTAINIQDQAGNTPLHVLFIESTLEKLPFFTNVLQGLLKSQEYPNFLLKNTQGTTLLQLVSESSPWQRAALLSLLQVRHPRLLAEMFKNCVSEHKDVSCCKSMPSLPQQTFVEPVMKIVRQYFAELAPFEQNLVASAIIAGKSNHDTTCAVTTASPDPAFSHVWLVTEKDVLPRLAEHFEDSAALEWFIDLRSLDVLVVMSHQPQHYPFWKGTFEQAFATASTDQLNDFFEVYTETFARAHSQYAKFNLKFLSMVGVLLARVLAKHSSCAPSLEQLNKWLPEVAILGSDHDAIQAFYSSLDFTQGGEAQLVDVFTNVLVQSDLLSQLSFEPQMIGCLDDVYPQCFAEAGDHSVELLELLIQMAKKRCFSKEVHHVGVRPILWIELLFHLQYQQGVNQAQTINLAQLQELIVRVRQQFVAKRSGDDQPLTVSLRQLVPGLFRGLRALDLPTILDKLEVFTVIERLVLSVTQNEVQEVDFECHPKASSAYMGTDATSLGGKTSANSDGQKFVVEMCGSHSKSSLIDHVKESTRPS